MIGDPRIPVDGIDTYEVFAGGYFVVHHVDVNVGEQPVRAIEVIGEPDAASAAYVAQSFDSEGHAELMRVTIGEDRVFHFVGGRDIAAAAQPTAASTARVRSPLTVAEDRHFDERFLGAIRRRHRLASVDRHLLHAKRLRLGGERDSTASSE